MKNQTITLTTPTLAQSTWRVEFCRLAWNQHEKVYGETVRAKRLIRINRTLSDDVALATIYHEVLGHACRVDEEDLASALERAAMVVLAKFAPHGDDQE